MFTIRSNRTISNVSQYLLYGKDPESIALRFPEFSSTYNALTIDVAKVSAYLLAAGAKKGERVLLVADNSLFWVACYLGIMHAGLVCVPIASSTDPADAALILRTTDPSIICAQRSAVARLSRNLAGKHLLTDSPHSPIQETASQTDFNTLPVRNSAFDWKSSINATDLAVLVFTSGSTGRPRGVMVSHGNIIANSESIISCLELTNRDRIMAVLPFHYCYGASLLHTHLRVGGEVVVENRFMYPEVVLQRMIEAGCTGFAGVPSHFQILLRNSTLRNKCFPTLRYVQQAGGHLAPAFIRELREVLPTTKIFIMYGQTEATARLSYLPPEYLDNKLGSIGKGMLGVTLRVLDEMGRDVEPGEVGEIVAEGGNVTGGYWQAPEESKTIFKNGRLYTGDLARVDKDGFIYIVDRANDFLKIRGEKINCRQVEDVLLECDELVEAAVVGVSDDVLGEAVKAFVVPREKDSTGLEERIIAFCKTRLPAHHLPKQIVVLASLPKSTAGKVMKRALRTI
jgi:long-chain acyl-CoA synthetase